MDREKIKAEIPKEPIQYLILISLLIVAVFYFAFFVKIAFSNLVKIGFFILIGLLSRIPQRLSHFSFGIELVTIGAISSAILYGSLAGAFVGTACFLISGFYTREAPQDVLVAVVGFALLGWFAPAVYGYFESLALTGLVLTILYDLGTNLAYVFLGHSPLNSLKFSAMHIPSNYLILKYLGAYFISL